MFSILGSSRGDGVQSATSMSPTSRSVVSLFLIIEKSVVWKVFSGTVSATAYSAPSLFRSVTTNLPVALFCTLMTTSPKSGVTPRLPDSETTGGQVGGKSLTSMVYLHLRSYHGFGRCQSLKSTLNNSMHRPDLRAGWLKRKPTKDPRDERERQARCNGYSFT